MSAIAQLLTVVFFACLSFAAQGEKLRIVTDPWAPYAYQENGQAKGIDYETTAIVLQRLGIDAEWQFLPWKRCLVMLEQGQADGALDIFHNHERDKSLLYPGEALSEVDFVLFYAKARPHPFVTLDDLNGLTIGTSPGYLYSSVFSDAKGLKREDGPSQEANFGKLARGRIDLLITDRRVGQRILEHMQLQDRIDQYPTVIARENQYLAVRRAAGMDLLIQRFGAELRRFKHEPAYAELVARYAGKARNSTNGLHEHESANR
ncbi:substrate-binding periplasmic protein [Pseudomonas sp. FEN]|uniref:substrate-binding periplasmic protein n=1 Tax=Pseudomonas sp. FEN TaxID=2767468 RepID=UPI00174C8B50|nr:transporter substrate-binding domain-containing protein [Pseudomonas sp. FEN]CAD5203284.1 ABC-type amino acid transport/signal transduction system, periplasmic component/domain [Pseudomonas sp. FEN]